MQYIQLQGQTASTLDTPVNGAYNLFIDTSDNLIKLKDENGNLIEGGGASISEITFSELNDLWDGSNLTAGQYYKITDYQTCYDQPNFTANGTPITTGNYKSGSVEPLIVFATSEGTLSPYAHSLDYPKDIIRYDISVTQTEVTNGLAKGRIYERIDQVGNRTDYDWRAVQFKRYRQYYAEVLLDGKVTLTATETTGSIVGVGTDFSSRFEPGDVIGVYNSSTGRIGGFDFYEVVDVSGSFYMGVTGSYYNEVSDKYYSNAYSLQEMSPFQTNTISVGKEESEYYTFALEGNPTTSGWYNNYLGDNNDWEVFRLSNNVFRGGSYRDNHFSSNFEGNTLNDGIAGNVCGRNFKYNVIDDDFDNNTIGDNFQYNFISCDFQENIIGNDFAWNMFADDDGGTDFNRNIINGSYFERNWFIGVDDFIDNVISDNFYDNIILNSFENNLVTGEVFNNLFGDDIENNQFKDLFHSNKIYDFFQNNVLNMYYDNITLNTFEGNQISGQAYSNIFSGSFFNNTVGNNFNNNTFQGIAAYNQIGSDFTTNTIGSEFGVGYGYPRANKIGNNVTGNTIGEYFYSNTISDNFINNTLGHYFQQNTVLANNVNNEDFTLYYGNIVSVTTPSPNIGGSDGTYNGVASTTTGFGVGATFNVTVSSGVASVTVDQPGTLYSENDTLTITGSLIGGGSNLTLAVEYVSGTPVVYRNIDSTILRNQNEELRLIYFGITNYSNVGILEQVD